MLILKIKNLIQIKKLYIKSNRKINNFNEKKKYTYL